MHPSTWWTAPLLLIVLFVTSVAAAQQRDRDHRGSKSRSTLCRQPTAYEHKQFRGRSVVLVEAISDLATLGFGDRASSICVPVGWTVELHEHDGHRGRSLRLRGPVTVADLARRGFDDLASSMSAQDRRARRPGGRHVAGAGKSKSVVREHRDQVGHDAQGVGHDAQEGGRLAARFDWSMSPRFGERHYDRQTHAYRSSYVEPAGWTITLDGCVSTLQQAAVPIVSYTWRISSGDRRYQRTYSTAKCKAVTGQSPQTAVGSRSRSALSAKMPMAARFRGRRGTVSTTRYRRSIDRRGIPSADDSQIGGTEPLPPPDPVDPEFELLPQLPALGHYRVSLTVEDKLGRTHTTTENLTLRDYLVVVVGDSATSGQGNPDTAGSPWEDPVAGTALPCETTKAAMMWLEELDDWIPFPVGTPPRWVEPLAQRSYRSGHVRSALALERSDPHSSVTFLSFATSGATISDLISTGQEDFQREKFHCAPGDECGQLREVRAAIGNRSIDALIISIGINNLGFSRALKKAVKGDLHNSRERQKAEGALNSIFFRYRDLASALRGLPVRDVYLTGYPVDIFSSDSGGIDDGCGIFDTSVLKLIGADGVSLNEAKLMNRIAEELEAKMADAARAFGWHFVKVSDAYYRHGYCASESFFRGAEESCKMQGDTNGMMHPNELGHRVYAERLFEALQRYTQPVEDEKVSWR